MLLEVFGCAGEGDRGKRPIMAKIATDKSDVTILTSDNPKTEDPCKYHSLKKIYQRSFLEIIMLDIIWLSFSFSL